MNEKPEWLTDMKVLSLKPGDVLVVRTEAGIYLTEADIARIERTFGANFPDNKVMLLENMDIGVISPSKQEDEL